MENETETKVQCVDKQNPDGRIRCAWCQNDEDLIRYHDHEWAVPTHDDRTHFEFLTLEIMQCGLNWKMILKKRRIIASCFDQFDFHKVAQYGTDQVEKILKTEGMIKNRRKVEAVIANAGCFERVAQEFGSFDSYIWKFTGGMPVLYEKNKEEGSMPSSNALSDRVSQDLKRRGFRFAGSITVYSYLQACGMINDHEKGCFLDEVIRKQYPAVSMQ